MTLRAAVRRRRGGFELDALVQAGDGETVAVLGPNGAGKTTLLRVLAGLLALEAGRVELGGRILEDTATGVRVPPERRGVAMLFPDHRLFPHLPAIDNVAFGLRSRGIRAAEARRRAGGWLERVGASAVASSAPGAMSSGQAQRVALARALITEPRLLLLDEPLAAVDAGARAGLRGVIRESLAGHAGVRLLVTHDPVEAAALGDRSIVLDAGRVVAEAVPA